MATPATTAAAYRSALGSVVKATAAVGTIFDVTSDSLSMLGSFVREHSERQQATHDTDRIAWLKELNHNSNIRLSSIRVEAEKFCSQSADHARFYDEADAQISAVLAKYYPSSKAEPSE